MMKAAYYAAVGVVAILLSACNQPSNTSQTQQRSPQAQQTPAPVTPPTPLASASTVPARASTVAVVDIETNSPDDAVKSWWRVRDLARAQALEQCKTIEQQDNANYLKYVKQVATGDVVAEISYSGAHCESVKLNRSIDKVSKESDTRAVVFATIRNISPVPAGADPDADDRKQRENGTKFKYVVEAASGGWRVSQVYRYDHTIGDMMEKYHGLKGKLHPWQEKYTVSDTPTYPSFVWND